MCLVGALLTPDDEGFFGVHDDLDGLLSGELGPLLVGLPLGLTHYLSALLTYLGEVCAYYWVYLFHLGGEASQAGGPCKPFLSILFDNYLTKEPKSLLD